MSAPPGALLLGEQLRRPAGSLQRPAGLAGRQRAGRAGQQQLGPLGLLAPDLVKPADALVRLGQRICWQPGREQGRAPFDAQGRVTGSDLVEPQLRLVEAGQGPGQVTAAQSEHAPVHHGVR
jgi:hypothetical protein